MLSATAVASLYRYDKTIHRIVLSATDNSRVPLLKCGVAGERTVQRCRQKQKDRTSCDLFLLAPQTEIPLTGEMSQSDKRVTARYEQLEPVTGQKYCRATVLGADVALCISSCSPHPFFCHRQRGTVSQLTAAYGCS